MVLEQHDVYSISRLNREARHLLETGFPVIWLKGEISNLARPASGHMYFSLKDEQAQVRCAMFKGRNRLLQFRPAEGMDILAQATVSLYESRGEFQLIVKHMEQAGIGALQRAYEALKHKLSKEGLFNEQHKQPLPAIPKTIGVITSPTGAAIRDILSILRRRYPLGNVIIYPAAVQGASAAQQIIKQIEAADNRQECEILIIARGGGSIEDLAAFNDESLARAVFACKIPVVSGIGHEIDFTITDFVSDRRAATPSAAAELASPDQEQLAHTVAHHCGYLLQTINNQLISLATKVDGLRKQLPHPISQLQNNMQKLDMLTSWLEHSTKHMLTQRYQRLQTQISTLHQHDPRPVLQAHKQKCRQLKWELRQAMAQLWTTLNTRANLAATALHALSPLATLDRGYSIVRRNDGALVNHAEQLRVGTEICAYLGTGKARCQVKEVDGKTNIDELLRRR